MSEILTALLGFISAYFVFRQNDKGNQLKYITDERQKWREKIRELSVAFITGKEVNGRFRRLNQQELKNIREQVAVRLNPKDPEDKHILNLMDLYIKAQNDSCLKDLSLAFSYLLKHDWERAKSEAKQKSTFVKVFLLLVSILIATGMLYWFNFFLHPLDNICVNCELEFADFSLFNFLYTSMLLIKYMIYVIIILFVYMIVIFVVGLYSCFHSRLIENSWWYNECFFKQLGFIKRESLKRN